MASADLTDTLICSACLTICKEPIRLRCGHKFCQECMDVQNTLKESGDHICLECRVEFPERQLSPETQPLSEDDIFRTDCTFSPLQADISCSTCDASLCDNHLRGHSKSEEHIFTCSSPKNALTHYCSEDEACICVICSGAEEHEEHQVEPLMEISEKRKENLKNVLEKLSEKKKAAKDRVEDLQKYLTEAQEKASGLSESVVALFRDIRRQLDALEQKALKDISNQEEQVRTSVCNLIHELEIKISNLSRDIKDMEELGTMTEPLPVFHRWESVKHDLGDVEELLNHDRCDLDVGLISATLHTALSDIVTSRKMGFYVEQTPDIVLDLNTASDDIYITGDLKSASGSEFKQSRPKIPERFQYNQVLSARSFSSGRHFLEVETCPTGNWRLGITYPSVARKGYHSLVGHSDKSWGLCRYLNQYFVIHYRKVIPVPHKPASQRLGIYLDYEAGQICFYELCNPIRHLYTYTTTFNEGLHLILGVYTGWVRIRS
ncbi:E3 ubiquitin-protein ligase TRIM58-like [Dendrobates tinctorius]|uniref:E3 ubiquitin-protein ligase TRIM58-like n=1 Tax=Dendrobates tinctorius TaxID=92724 RepID=UPI003CC97DB7